MQSLKADSVGSNQFNGAYNVGSISSGMRVEVKHPRYVAIHRASNDLTEHQVWEILRLSDSVDEQLELVPDESYGWLDAAKSNLEQQFSDAPSRAQHEFDDIMTTSG